MARLWSVRISCKLSLPDCCLILFILERGKVQATNNISCFPSRLWPSSFGVLSFRQQTDGVTTGDMNLDLCLCIMCSAQSLGIHFEVLDSAVLNVPYTC